MKTLKVLLIAAVSLMMCISTAYAYNFGTNITKNDGRTYGSASSTNWYNNNSTYVGEDNEVEPNNVIGQVWDLEGFFLNGNKQLSMVGGFNFKDGVYSSDWKKTFISGDIFLDTSISTGYEYAIKLSSWKTDGTGGTYKVYSLTSGSILSNVYFSANYPSNPWILASGGTEITSGSFTAETTTALGFLGYSGNNTHYAVEGIDLSFLPYGTTFTAHFTQECGNDNLMGSAAVPEPAALLLLGLGLVGIGILRRKQ